MFETAHVEAYSDYEVFGQAETLTDKALSIQVSLPEIFS